MDAGYGVGCGPHDTDDTARAAAAELAAARVDVWRAVDGLTRPRRTRLSRDDGVFERVELPALYGQLVEAMRLGGETGGSSRGVPASRPPTDAGALSLLIEIAQQVGYGCRQRRIKRRFDTPIDLRALVSHIARDGDLERIDDCTRVIQSWCARIRVTIGNDPDRTWRMHGAACRVCKATTVPGWDVDGNETRQPAMIVHSEDGKIDKIECGFCGSTLTGPDLVAIVRTTQRQAVDDTSEIA